MAAQQELGEALRAGFLSLAQARYSLGADRVSPLQYPSHMSASARVRAAGERRCRHPVVQPVLLCRCCC